MLITEYLSNLEVEVLLLRKGDSRLEHEGREGDNWTSRISVEWWEKNI